MNIEFKYEPRLGQPDAVPVPERRREKMPTQPDPSKAPNPADFPDKDNPYITPAQPERVEPSEEPAKEDA